MLLRFVDPNNTLTRRYLLKKLNVEFLRDAASLPAATLAALAGKGPGGVHRVLLDSNFVFAVLGLHDAPANDLSNHLLSIAGKCRSEIPTKFLVLPITIDEIKRTLQSVIFRLGGVAAVSADMAKAAISLSSGGLVARYLTERSKSLVRLTPEEFFGPIERNVVQILQAKGINVLNENLDDLRTNQFVIDGIHDLNDAQQSRDSGPKPYESNLHDMVLWTYARNKLPAVVESPLDGRMWIVTFDYGLINWDRRKRGPKPPVVVNPSDLTQLLAFFVPRGEEYERVLVETLREPLLFMDFDAHAEATTLTILGHLAKYENSNAFSADTVRTILVNDSLRSKLSTKNRPTQETEAVLVRDAIVATAEHRKEKLDLTLQENEGLLSQNDSLVRRVTELELLVAAPRSPEIPFSPPTEIEPPDVLAAKTHLLRKERLFLLLVGSLVTCVAILGSLFLDRFLSNVLVPRNRLLIYVLSSMVLVSVVIYAGLRTLDYQGKLVVWVRRLIKFVIGVGIVGLVLGVVGNDLFTDLHDGKPGKTSSSRKSK